MSHVAPVAPRPESGARPGPPPAVPVIRIRPSSGWAAIDFRELWDYRDLFGILAMRDVKVRYKQTALGVVWVILQPLVTSLIFAIVFGRLGNLPSDGLPYLLFAFAGMLPWYLFAQSLQRAGESLVVDNRLISKVYFPRMIVPLASVLAVLVDFAVAAAVMLALMVYYGHSFGPTMLLVPILLLITLLAAAGAGLGLSALNAKYRDFMYALPFLIQAWMYASPVAYSTTLIPERWQALYALNPMVGLIEGFRWSLLGRGAFSPATVAPAVAMTALLLVGGALLFRRMEDSLADVI